MENGIDFVIMWVDGSDPAWLEEKSQYDGKLPGQNEVERYRDWDQLRYWFRSIEVNAPWVRKIHFVTWGHLPPWLDTDNPKLNIVRHTDFIPGEYLPTYSSHTIELNLHRIPGLADQFVLFNDDVFLTRPVKPNDFFAEGLPRDIAALNVHCNAISMPIQLICAQDVGVINDHFAFRQSIRTHWKKWFSLGYGKKLLQTIFLLGCPRFPGFFMPHTAQSYLKSTFEEVWAAEPKLLHTTCTHKFRQAADVNQWVMREWQMAKGQFVPRANSFSRNISLAFDTRREQAKEIADILLHHKVGSLCINDYAMPAEDFEYCKQVINQAFEQAYPRESSFEKD